MTDPTPDQADHFFVVESRSPVHQPAARIESRIAQVEGPTVPEVREADLAAIRHLIARYGVARLRQLITVLAAEVR